ncbi:peroxide-responsive transcriptional repressor PerR [Abyssicoccus albus]|uniref:peroxide-responsive transcriptional repressor PerR n=1 Tax=Abyssicoccus albus TaxID=1817405 RepID=UPI00097E405D|nr:peroxide-responsive transcriptional repressor PerR [Abyssicoccus albus]AQL55837.1 transcriptional repressor [Abyssicoccus albus]
MHHTTEHDILKESIHKLRETGVRITPQRQAVLNYMIKSDDHPTADDIYKALVDEFPNISVATVYNNLRLFKDTGLVNELPYGDASSRFDFITSAHYHVICTECGKITDFNYPALNEVETLAKHVTNFDITHHRMEVYGLCPECAENTNKS